MESCSVLISPVFVVLVVLVSCSCCLVLLVVPVSVVLARCSCCTDAGEIFLTLRRFCAEVVLDVGWYRVQTTFLDLVPSTMVGSWSSRQDGTASWHASSGVGWLVWCG